MPAKKPRGQKKKKTAKKVVKRVPHLQIQSVGANGLVHVVSGKGGYKLRVYGDAEEAIDGGVGEEVAEGIPWSKKGYCRTIFGATTVTCESINCTGTCAVYGGPADGDLGRIGKPPITVKEGWVYICICE